MPPQGKTYTLFLASPYASEPAVCWRVNIEGGDLHAAGLAGPYFLYVPQPDRWLDATLFAVLHELASYLPAHDPAEATVIIQARRRPRRGRAPKVPRPPRSYDCDVMLVVQARGWSASVRTCYDDREQGLGAYKPLAKEFNAPMLQLLLDLAAQSPLPLTAIPYEAPAESARWRPARSSVIHERRAIDPRRKPTPRLFNEYGDLLERRRQEQPEDGGEEELG